MKRNFRDVITDTLKYLKKVERQYNDSTLEENHYYACGVNLTNTLVLFTMNSNADTDALKKRLHEVFDRLRVSSIESKNALNKNQYSAGVNYAVRMFKKAITLYEYDLAVEKKNERERENYSK